MNKKLILSLLGISLFSILSSNLIFQSEASNISKNQEDTAPLITYTTEQIGDREKMRVTVSVQDRSGSGIKEFRDHNNNLINSDTITVEFNRRINATFIAIDNNNNKSKITIDLNWINPYTKGITGRKIYGSAYWTSSNLREWLNSDSPKVDYTCSSPSYKDEPGFLNGFTDDEKDAIAVTRRRQWINSSNDSIAIEGGSGTPGHANVYGANAFLGSLKRFAFEYKKFSYKSELDKVFTISPFEAYWYLNRRGFDYKFPLSTTAKIKNSINDNYYDWWMNGGCNFSENDAIYFGRHSTSNPGTYTTSNKKLGILPAINIKPNFIFADGRKASELNIGDTVIFGRYLNAPITWRVINKTQDNFPFLISTEILDIKEFDSEGDEARLYSDYVEYKNHDISLLEDVQYVSTKNLEDIEIPTLKILNKSELDIRQNNSFTLEIEAIDEDSGIDYIITPDGNKIRENKISYTFNKNNHYIFKIMDNAGNYNEFMIPISNINEEPFINIEQSSKDWSTRNIIVDINTSNNVRYMKDLIKINNLGGFGGSVFPNYTNYAGKKFLITGTISLDNFEPIALERDGHVILRFYYLSKDENKYSYELNGNWNSFYKFYIKDLIDGPVEFSIEHTIPINYASGLQPQLECGNLPSILGNVAQFRITDLKYEAIDIGNDLTINSIKLPTGEIIFKDKYVDTISKEGINNWLYTITDSRGKETVKTITTKIDKTSPTLNLNYNTNTTNQNISVNISASDATSGVKRIKLPNGNYITNLNSTYTISGDGEYIFECEDVAGNITTKTITINNIDKEKPNVIIDKNNTEWTNQGVQININTRD